MKLLSSILIVGSLILPACAQTLWSQNTSDSYWRGSVELRRDSRKVTVHETYLEIEEEVELAVGGDAGWGDAPEGSRNALEIYGKFEFPAGSVVSGAILWDGNKILRAKLKTKADAESEYNDTVDHDWEWIPSPTDPLMIGLSKRANSANYEITDTYDFKLFPVKWGDTRKLRIRYLSPVKNSDGAFKMNIGSAFGRACNVRPSSFTLELTGSTGISSVALTNNKKVTYAVTSDAPLILNMPYVIDMNYYVDSHSNPNYGKVVPVIVDMTEKVSGGKFFTTAVDTGALAGEYLHFLATVPDELFTNAGVRREVVFLWRWENENSLVDWNNYSKYLSGYGYKALEQAGLIRDAAYRLLDGKAGVSMIHDRSEGSRDTVFAMGSKGSVEAANMTGYLDFLINNGGENIISGISGYEVTGEGDGDTLTAEQIDSIYFEGKNDFDVAITSIKSLFSPEEKVIRHVVLVTVGKRKTDSKMVYTDSIKGLEGVTFSGYGTDSQFPDGYWPGVDTKKICADRKLQDGESYSGYRIPKMQNVNLTLYLKTSKRINGFSIPKSGTGNYNYDQVYFTGHAANVWKDTVRWEAQDDAGNILGSYVQVPQRVSSPNDSDLIMLWGGSSSSPYSETIKSGSLGYLIGFVDESYSLLAMPYDSVSSALKKQLEDGADIGNLSRDEIFGPVKLKTAQPKVVRTGISSVIKTASGVQFNINLGTAKNVELVIYDLKGRVVMRFSHDQLIGMKSLMWDGATADGSSLSAGMYIARLSLDSYSSAVKFAL